MCEALCALGAPPPFDLPPPPDPSLVWPDLFDAADPFLVSAEASAFLELAQQHSRRHSDDRRPAGAIADATCQAFRVPFAGGVGDAGTSSAGSVILRAIASIWSDVDGGDAAGGQPEGAWSRGQYALVAVFTLLLVGCFAAILALRKRRRRHSSAADDSPTRKNRLKSQRSTPSLNSSKLSTETVGTATATMIASVGSGGGGSAGAGPYRYTTTTTTNNNDGSVVGGNEAGCYGTHRAPQHHRSRPTSQVPPLPYHSATISRRVLVPPLLQCHRHHHHYHHDSNMNNGSCGGGMTNYGVNHSGSISCCEDGTTMMPCHASCCAPVSSSNNNNNNKYQQQQLLNNNNNGRMYNSQSATNIFGPNGLVLSAAPSPLCTHPSSALMRCDAHSIINNNNNDSGGGPYQRCSSTLLRGSARMPPRCAALRVLSPPGINNNIDHSNVSEQQQQYHEHPSFTTTNNNNFGGSQSTLPYDYETIDNGSGYGMSSAAGGGRLFYYDPISSTVVPTTVHRPTMIHHTYVDTSSHCDGGSKTTIFEDLSESLRNDGGGGAAANNSNPQRHPPPSSRPPPPPPPLRQDAAVLAEQQQPPQRTSTDGSASSSAASISSADTELQQLITVAPKVTEPMYDGSINVYDPTCDDAFSSFSPRNNAAEEQLSSAAADDCGATPPPHQRGNGRESGYGTGRSRREVGAQRNHLNLAPPADDAAGGGESEPHDFPVVSNGTEPMHFHHLKQSARQPSMTYV